MCRKKEASRWVESSAGITEPKHPRLRKGGMLPGWAEPKGGSSEPSPVPTIARDDSSCAKLCSGRRGPGTARSAGSKTAPG